jgi:methyl-accepting chemotaxis protein
MLNNLRIGKRLGFGFGLIVLILMGAVGVGVLGFMNSLATLKQVKSQTAQIILAQDAHAHFLQTMTFVGAVAAAQDSANTETYVQQVEAERAAYTANLAEIAPLNITEASQRIFGELTAAVAAVRETNGKVLGLAKAGQHGEAAALFDAESCPRIAKVNAAFEKFNARRKELMSST